MAAIAILLCGWGVWFVLRPDRQAGGGDSEGSRRQILTVDDEPLEIRLQRLIGRPAKEIVRQLDLAEATWYWVDEPPGILRGVSYLLADKRSVSLYVAEGEPLFRRLDFDQAWDYEEFLSSRVGGIQYKEGEVWLDIGPDVPWQFERR